MNRKTLLICVPFMSLLLTSCNDAISYKEHLDDYIYTMQYHNNFNILQLTDIHWNANSSTSDSKRYLNKLFEEVDNHLQARGEKIDLVELTGDQFMLANTYHVKTFISYFEEKAEQYGFEYASIWGNHDRHGLYNPNWLSDRFKNAKHSIYLEPDDDLYGRSNFVINLTDGGGNTVWQIANLDSGASFSETAISVGRDYDYIREDQVDWWLKENEKANNAPTIAYYHIAQDENEKAWQDIKVDPTRHTNKFFKLEDFASNESEKYASNFIDEGRTHNLKAAFMGHAHNVDWTVDYDGVLLGLGVKTGPELYFAHIDVNSNDDNMKKGLESIQEAGISENFDLIGASLVTIKDTDNFDLEHLYFNERANENFAKWVKW